MSKIENSSDPSTANLGRCNNILLDGFDGDERAVLVIGLTKPLMIDGHLRKFAGIVLDNYERLEELAGVEVIITRQWDMVGLSYTQTDVDKRLTIAEWRRELSRDEKQPG